LHASPLRPRHRCTRAARTPRAWRKRVRCVPVPC
jgi:hypothetical protein